MAPVAVKTNDAIRISLSLILHGYFIKPVYRRHPDITVVIFLDTLHRKIREASLLTQIIHVKIIRHDLYPILGPHPEQSPAVKKNTVELIASQRL